MSVGNLEEYEWKYIHGCGGDRVVCRRTDGKDNLYFPKFVLIVFTENLCYIETYRSYFVYNK